MFTDMLQSLCDGVIRDFLIFVSVLLTQTWHGASALRRHFDEVFYIIYWYNPSNIYLLRDENLFKKYTLWPDYMLISCRIAQIFSSIFQIVDHCLKNVYFLSCLHTLWLYDLDNLETIRITFGLYRVFKKESMPLNRLKNIIAN